MLFMGESEGTLAILYIAGKGRKHGYEAEQIAREEAVADCQRESQEEAAAQTKQEAAEKQLAFKKDQLNRAKALLTEPEKGPDVSQVCAKC
jgi:hypothetical protein